MNNKRTLGSILLILTAFIWGTAFVAQRVGMEKIEPITFNAARMAVAAVAVGAVALAVRLREKRKGTEPSGPERKMCRKHTLLGGIACGVFLSLGSIFQQMGIVYTTAGKAGFITAMYILLVPVIGFVLFKRKNNWLVWFAVLLGVAGLYLLCMTESFSLSRGDALVICCAVFFSCHILSCDYFARRGEPVALSAIQFLVATAISALVALIAEEPSAEKLASAALPILYCGFISGGLGYTLQIVGQRYTDPTVASILMSLESVFAVIAGTLLLHEKMSVRELIGCAVLFTAVILVQLPVRSRSRDRREDRS
jgi:drug/metabolite transporter (DMT)-like permease